MSVLTRILSPVLTKGGTCTTRPVSSVAGLSCALAVAPLIAGRRVLHHQVDRQRQLDADRLAAVELHLDHHLGEQVIHRITEGLARDVDLLERVGVHEVVVGAVVVHVLHRTLVERRALDEIFRSQFVVGQGAAADIARLHAHEAAEVAGRDVLYIERAEQVLVQLEQHALAQLRRLNRGHRLRYPAGAEPCEGTTDPAHSSNMLRFSRWLSRAGIRCATCSRSRNAWSGSRGVEAAGWTPPVDLYETSDAFIVSAELPGLSREDIDIRFHDGQLTLQGTRRKPDVPCERYHRVERGHGSFHRRFSLPSSVSCR